MGDILSLHGNISLRCNVSGQSCITGRFGGHISICRRKISLDNEIFAGLQRQIICCRHIRGNRRSIGGLCRDIVSCIDSFGYVDGLAGIQRHIPTSIEVALA